MLVCQDSESFVSSIPGKYEKKFLSWRVVGLGFERVWRKCRWELVGFSCIKVLLRGKRREALLTAIVERCGMP